MKLVASLLACLLAAACGTPWNPKHADAMSAEGIEPLAEDRLALKWKFVASDRSTEISPQEFAAPAVTLDTIYFGSAGGKFFALRTATGQIRWKKQLGSVACAPLLNGGVLYIGTNDGFLVALDSTTGKEKWRYQGRGPIEQTPTAAGDLIVFANEADQVIAVDALSGKYKWQYKSETPEEYTLRGHAGVVLDGELLYTGFSNGTLVALRKETGSIAWSTSLKADAERFMDVDATPIVLGQILYASSSSGGVYAIDKSTGLVKWRVPFYDVALPSSTGGGEPGAPVVFDDMLVYSLADDGLFLAERRTGKTLEYFDPGDGVSAQPTITSDGQLFVMSNRGILYAFDVD